jgi:calcineurin-like phosphoesterase family protein
MRRIGAIALVLSVGLGFAMAAQAKPKHQPLKCKAGYTHRAVWTRKRVHGRIVRRHGRIVYIKVQRCVKKPKPKPSSPVPSAGTPTTPTVPQPPGTPTATSPSPSPSPTVPSPPPPPPPVNTALPTITGSPTQGSTLSASTGAWTNAPMSYGYQWQRCNTGGCQSLTGQTSSTYPLGSNDVGSTVRVSVAARNASGSASATSVPTSTVAPTGGSSGDPVVVAVGDIARPPGCAPNCEQSATAALAQTFNPAAVVVLGDNQYEAPNESIDSYSDYMGSYDLTWGRDFNSIVHPVPGNHEYLGSNAGGYFDYFGGHGVTTNPPAGYYSFNLGNWHILALNSNCTDHGCGDALDGGTTSAQLTWLNTDLTNERAANPNACVLATWHHPLFSAGWTLGVPNVAPLYNALYNAHADVVLNGHDHLYERFAQMDPSGNAITTGIREFVVGTGGESLNGLSASPSTLQASDAKDFGVLVLTLHSSSYTWKFVTTGGAVIDSGTAGCHGAGAGAAIASAVRHAARTVVARLDERPLIFDASPLRSSLASVKRSGLGVAVFASRAVDVSVTASLRHGHRLTRIASFFETESQITTPHSVIRLHLPARRLEGVSVGTLVLRFAAEDGAGHRHTVTRTVGLR